MEPCLLVEFETDGSHQHEVSQVMAEFLYESSFLVESGRDEFTLVFYSKPTLFSSCVVWCATQLEERKKRKVIGNYTLTALNFQHHTPVILDNYGVIAPHVEPPDEKSCHPM